MMKSGTGKPWLAPARVTKKNFMTLMGARVYNKQPYYFIRVCYACL